MFPPRTLYRVVLKANPLSATHTTFDVMRLSICAVKPNHDASQTLAQPIDQKRPTNCIVKKHQTPRRINPSAYVDRPQLPREEAFYQYIC